MCSALWCLVFAMPSRRLSRRVGFGGMNDCVESNVIRLV